MNLLSKASILKIQTCDKHDIEVGETNGRNDHLLYYCDLIRQLYEPKASHKGRSATYFLSVCIWAQMIGKQVCRTTYTSSVIGGPRVSRLTMKEEGRLPNRSFGECMNLYVKDSGT